MQVPVMICGLIGVCDLQALQIRAFVPNRARVVEFGLGRHPSCPIRDKLSAGPVLLSAR